MRTAIVCAVIVLTVAGGLFVQSVTGFARAMGSVAFLSNVLAARFYGWRVSFPAAIGSIIAFDVAFIGPHQGWFWPADWKVNDVMLFATLLICSLVAAPDLPWLPRVAVSPLVPDQPLVVPKPQDYVQALEIGAAIGRQIAEQIERGDTSVLGWKVEEFVKSGEYGGFETGFCAAVSRRLGRADQLLTIAEIEQLIADNHPDQLNFDAAIVRPDGDRRPGAVDQ